MTSPRFNLRRPLRPRSGIALVIVIVLIGLFGALCQALTLLAAMQHRQAFHQAGQAQAHRLAEAGLRRAAAQFERDPQWSGETWKPMLPGGETATVLLRVKRRQADHLVLEAEASFETGPGRIHKVNQSLAAAATPARELKEVGQP
jgi:hypothetical protein